MQALIILDAHIRVHPRPLDILFLKKGDVHVLNIFSGPLCDVHLHPHRTDELNSLCSRFEENWEEMMI